MTMPAEKEEQRRQFLKWLSASPLLPLLGGTQLFAQENAKRPDPMIWTSPTIGELMVRPRRPSTCLISSRLPSRKCRQRTLPIWPRASMTRSHYAQTGSPS